MTSRHYVSVADARSMPGLRIVFIAGYPVPWSEAVRAFYDIKGIDYVAVEQRFRQPSEDLRAWTGQTSAPVVMLDDDRPRIAWQDMLVLAEQIAPEPRLIPQDEDDRATMFGLCQAICGDDGFGWSVRQLMLQSNPESSEEEKRDMRRKYIAPVARDHLVARAGAVMAALARRLEAQGERGSDYLVGDAVTAADIYWTTFSNFVAAMSPEQCPMPRFYREMPKVVVGLLGFGAPDILIRHRDQILARHFILPMRL
jgi:glutathione S-transferase